MIVHVFGTVRINTIYILILLFLSGDDPEKLSSGQRRKTNHSAAQGDRVSLPVQGKAKNAVVRTPFNTPGGWVYSGLHDRLLLNIRE